jgi:hypothetical protein
MFASTKNGKGPDQGCGEFLPRLSESAAVDARRHVRAAAGCLFGGGSGRHSTY